MEDSMSTDTRSHTHTRRVSVPAYYVGRPATLWLAALAPTSTTTNRLAHHAPAEARYLSPNDT
jgi:hypothetical protein